MGLETGTYISDLVATNPVGATDDRATADDHLRLIKAVLQNTFPTANSAINISAFIKTLLDDSDAATARGTLGLGSMATKGIATGTYTTASLATGAGDERWVSHGLGTDDVDFGAVLYGSNTLGDGKQNVIGRIAGPLGEFTDFGYADAQSFSFSGLPTTGNLAIIVKNNHSASQSITVKWWARTR